MSLFDDQEVCQIGKVRQFTQIMQLFSAYV